MYLDFTTHHNHLPDKYIPLQPYELVITTGIVILLSGSRIREHFRKKERNE